MKNILTPEIAASWLTDATIPSGDELRSTYGLHRWSMFDGKTALLPYEDFVARHIARDNFVRTTCWGIPSAEAIHACLTHGPLVEVGAGRGFWSALIGKAGGDVVATDANPFEEGFSAIAEMGGEDAVFANPDRNVLMVWPCYKSPWSEKAAARMQPGRVLILVSEGCGGCVGDDGLFELLRRDFVEIDSLPLPQWPGINDYMSIHMKRETST